MDFKRQYTASVMEIVIVVKIFLDSIDGKNVDTPRNKEFYFVWTWKQNVVSSKLTD